MTGFKQRFERLEQKYLLTDAQRSALETVLDGRFAPDEYGESRICSLYYDTAEYRLIRRSLERPPYKEKLRLRTYGVPSSGSMAFAEIKKKFRGVVYKRRIGMTYAEALRYLGRDAPPPEITQISREIDWMFELYPGLCPAMLIAYDRTALFGANDPELRLTFDRAITWRTDDLDISHGADGQQLLPPGMCLMELKVPNTVPLWLAHELDRLRIYPTSFSKYGEAYRRVMDGTDAKTTSQNNNTCRKDINYA